MQNTATTHFICKTLTDVEGDGGRGTSVYVDLLMLLISLCNQHKYARIKNKQRIWRALPGFHSLQCGLSVRLLSAHYISEVSNSNQSLKKRLNTLDWIKRKHYFFFKFTSRDLSVFKTELFSASELGTCCVSNVTMSVIAYHWG